MREIRVYPPRSSSKKVFIRIVQESKEENATIQKTRVIPRRGNITKKSRAELPAQYRQTRKMYRVFWKYEATSYRVFGRLSVRVNTRQCPPFVRPVYRRCLPNKSLYTRALFVSVCFGYALSPIATNDTPCCLWNCRPWPLRSSLHCYKRASSRKREREANDDAKYFTMEHVRTQRRRRRRRRWRRRWSTRGLNRNRQPTYAYLGWLVGLRDELLGIVGLGNVPLGQQVIVRRKRLWILSLCYF